MVRHRTQLFASIDTDHSGTLSRAEVIAALKTNADLMFELTTLRQTNLRLFQRWDRDGDGQVTLHEFLDAFLQWE